MKKTILLLLLSLFATFIQVDAQELVSADQFNKLISYLEKEDWTEAAKLSESCLKQIPADKIDDDAPAIIRYMFLTSEAGLMNEGKLSQQQALKNVKDFEGHTLTLPSLYISTKSGFNYLQPSENKTDTLHITYTNRKATDIFAFESLVPLKPISMEEFSSQNGKLCTVSGWLKKISVEGNILPRYRILIEKTVIGLKD
jgi:hypothetical protein